MNSNSLSDFSTPLRAFLNDSYIQCKTYIITTYNNNEAIITRLEKKPKLYRLPRLWVWYRYFYPHIFVTLFFVFMIIAFTAWNHASGHLVLGSILSLLSSCSVVTSYVMIIPWRKHPSSLILYRALTSVVFSINIILNAVSVNNKNCRSYATVTELMLLAGEAWLTTIAADLVASITNPFTSYKANVQRYQIMVWTCSALITFVFFFDTNCQGRFDNAICWVDIQYQNSACLWGYYLIWMILMYAYQMWASIYAYLRLQKGLPATFEIRKKCAEETFRVLISYAVYMSIVGIFYVIVSTTAPTSSSTDNTVIEHNKFAFFVLFVIANKGSVDGAVWFMLHEFESSSSSSNNHKKNMFKSSSSSSSSSSGGGYKNSINVGNTKSTSMSSSSSFSVSDTHSTAYNPLLNSHSHNSSSGMINIRNNHVNFNNNNDNTNDDDDGSISPFRDDPLPHTTTNDDDDNMKLNSIEEGQSHSTTMIDTDNENNINTAASSASMNSSSKKSRGNHSHNLISNITQNTSKIADHLHVKDVQKEMKNIQKNLTQTITELADLAIEEVDEGDLSPQVNMALRQQIVQYVTSGVKQSVTRVMSSGKSGGSHYHNSSNNNNSSNANNTLNHSHGVPTTSTPTTASTAASVTDATRTHRSSSMNNKTHAAAASVSSGVTDAAHVVTDTGEKFKAYVDTRNDPAVVEGIQIMNFLLDTDQLPFKSFAYDLFHEIRVNEGISDEYYLELLSSPANERLSEGASGAFMFFCGEGEFIVKTIRSREAKVLHNSMKQYSDYLRSNKESLLCKFLGSYSLQVYSQTFYFVIMRNCFDPHADINERYDIKGSWVGRSADPSKTKKRATCRHCNTYFIPAKKEACNVIIGPHEENVVLKDNDMRIKISLHTSEAKRILAILKKDSDLLGELGVIDYSLLIGIKKWKFPIYVNDDEIEKSKKPRKRTSSTASTTAAGVGVTAAGISNIGNVDSGNNSLNNSTGSSHHHHQSSYGLTSSTHSDTSTTSTTAAAVAAITHAATLASHKQPKYKAYSITGPAVYYFGIVDFLQDWTFNKKIERTAKIYLLRKDAEGLSVTMPLPYKYRFQKKMEQIFDIDETFDNNISNDSGSNSSSTSSSSSSGATSNNSNSMSDQYSRSSMASNSNNLVSSGSNNSRSSGSGNNDVNFRTSNNLTTSSAASIDTTVSVVNNTSSSSSSSLITPTVAEASSMIESQSVKLKQSQQQQQQKTKTRRQSTFIATADSINANHHDDDDDDDVSGEILRRIENCRNSKSTCSGIVEIFNDNSRFPDNAVKTEPPYSNFREAVNKLENGHFIVCSTAFELTPTNTFQGGNAHVFCLLKKTNNILWIEGNSYRTLMFVEHTGSEWFGDVVRCDQYFEDDGKAYFDSNKDLLKNWEKRGEIFLQCVKDNPKFVRMFIGDSIRKYRVGKVLSTI